ncbi:MAG TPA: pyrophosphate--fructose-6-phosphate 1-phosphotransferase [Kiritimatiellia bacterium]|nr:pyrophosphate--fructose-6-phosphate 1-phosphotransferase [Kiritimatiellia bacterium]HRU71514.1 pyrophosphate--fructose-6-phosphate 1-phosphotransferase [Kiritimatiellia bacterium]
MSKQVKKVGILTAGGLAPCLSSAIGYLIDEYTRTAPEVEIIGYVNGYMGLLKGQSITVTPDVRKHALYLTEHGGSPIGNSRVKLTNVKDCVRRGLVKEGQDPQKVAADQLVRDGVDVLHTIGGDDTNTAAADLAAFLAQNGYGLTVVGLPKTIDNDVYPIRQSLGAWTAAEEGAKYFANIVKENTANPRMLIVHEVMGRNCGWLTAATAAAYRRRMDATHYLPEFGLTRDREEIHAVYVPEMAFDVKAEAERLRKVMDANDGVNIFVSEGACVDAIIAELEAAGEEVPRDAFGHPRLDKVNVGGWFAKQFGGMLGAEKTMVQKSGYYSRAAAPIERDKELIQACARKAVECALAGVGGVVGEDEERNGELRACEFPRIKGGKPFDIDTPWFTALLETIGQPKGAKVSVKH